MDPIIIEWTWGGKEWAMRVTQDSGRTQTCPESDAGPAIKRVPSSHWTQLEEENTGLNWPKRECLARE